MSNNTIMIDDGIVGVGALLTVAPIWTRIVPRSSRHLHNRQKVLKLLFSLISTTPGFLK